MSLPQHNEHKKEFQLERLILFSDAVFAIAITLQVIEIKIPDIHENVSDPLLLQAIAHLVPKFVGFLVSFMLIGLYWTIHHKMFGFVTNYNRRLVILNLFFLFFIALMPFSAGFYSEYANKINAGLKVPLTFYVLNFVAAGFVNALIWRTILNPKYKLAEPAIDPVTAQLAKLRSLTVPLVFLSMLPVAYFIDVRLAIYMPMFIPIILSTMKKRILKKHKILPVKAKK